MRGDLYTDRRFKRFRVNPLHVLTTLLQWQWAEFLTLCKPVGIPEDVRVVGVQGDWEPPSITLLLYHPSWPEVPADQQAPWADPPFLQMETVRLLRAPDHPQHGHLQYRAPDVAPDAVIGG